MVRQILLIAAVWLGLSVSTFATVRPEAEWFQTPGNLARWQQMLPVLQDWEFNPHKPLLGSRLDRLAGIEEAFGAVAGGAAPSSAITANAVDWYKHDLNLDGKVDQFDVLELGYEVVTPAKHASIAPSSGTNEWVLLRMDFQDQSANYSTYNEAYFEQRMFQDNAPKPSCNDYYQEVSYGKLSIDGVVATSGPNGDGWFKGSHNKQWYIDNGGDYLVYEAVLAADAEIDFSDYDVDGDGYVDTVMVFYPNQVYSGGLWPHRSSGLDIHVDGVIVDSYFLTGYDTGNDSKTMVISVHEYGHILGLPDLYDTSYNSSGVGAWSLMSYNYDNDQKVPNVDPWSKIQLGWVTPTVITDNVSGRSLGCFQDNPVVLKVWQNGEEGEQYFLLANYRKKKTDANRPGEGLLIFHIDDSIGGGNTDNSNEDRKHVDVESARGAVDPNATNPKDPLDNGSDQGNINDLFFSGNSAPAYTGLFNDTSNPSSKNYPNPGSATGISVSNISAPGDTMTLDISVVTADAPSCTITNPLASATLSGNATIDVAATPAGTRTITKVEFYCNNAYLGSDESAPYSWTFNTSAYANSGAILRAVATDSGADIDTSVIEVTISNSATSVPYFEGFESGLQDWAAYNRMGSLSWRRWTQRKYSGSASAGIGSATGGYDYDERDELVSVALDLSASNHPIALWQQRYSVANGENSCYVFISTDDGATWELLKAYTGTNYNWHPAAADLLPYIGHVVRLKFQLDGSSLNRNGGEGGWWIDALQVRELSTAPEISSITPSDGATLNGMSTITVEASDDVAVSAVAFYIDGDDLITTDYSAPFSYSWNSGWCFNGSHTFTAVAYDADLQSDSESVTWTTSNSGQGMRWFTDFESDPAPAWRIQNLSGTGLWQWLSGSGYNSTGGMRLVTPSGSTYGDNDSDWLISPILNLVGVTDPYVWFYHKYRIENGGVEYDRGYLYVTTDLDTWTEVARFSNDTMQPWTFSKYPLSAYSGQNIKLAWKFDSDGGLTYEGWWLDNAEVNTKPVIVSLVPSRAKIGDSITINGAGFGSGAALESPVVSVGGIAAAVGTWTETSITITVPAGVHSGDSVVVSRHGVASDGAELRIILAPPVLDDVGELH